MHGNEATSCALPTTSELQIHFFLANWMIARCGLSSFQKVFMPSPACIEAMKSQACFDGICSKFSLQMRTKA